MLRVPACSPHQLPVQGRGDRGRAMSPAVTPGRLAVLMFLINKHVSLAEEIKELIDQLGEGGQSIYMSCRR